MKEIVNWPYDQEWPRETVTLHWFQRFARLRGGSTDGNTVLVRNIPGGTLVAGSGYLDYYPEGEPAPVGECRDARYYGVTIPSTAEIRKALRSLGIDVPRLPAANEEDE